MTWATIIAWLAAHWVQILALFGIGTGAAMTAGVNPLPAIGNAFGYGTPTRDDAIAAHKTLLGYFGTAPTAEEKAALKAVWDALGVSP